MRPLTQLLCVQCGFSWLPGMDSNHELDRFLKSRNLLILKSRRSRQRHQKHASGTKSVQNILRVTTTQQAFAVSKATYYIQHWLFHCSDGGSGLRSRLLRGDRK
jgi:hypothetical protein